MRKIHNGKIYYSIPWEATFLTDALAIAVDCMQNTKRLYYVDWAGESYYSDEIKEYNKTKKKIERSVCKKDEQSND